MSATRNALLVYAAPPQAVATDIRPSFLHGSSLFRPSPVFITVGSMASCGNTTVLDRRAASTVSRPFAASTLQPPPGHRAHKPYHTPMIFLFVLPALPCPRFSPPTSPAVERAAGRDTRRLALEYCLGSYSLPLLNLSLSLRRHCERTAQNGQATG